VLIFDDILGDVPSAVVITVELFLGKDCCNSVELELCLSGCRLVLLVHIHVVKRVMFISLPLSVRSQSGANVYRLETKKAVTVAHALVEQVFCRYIHTYATLHRAEKWNFVSRSFEKYPKI